MKLDALAFGAHADDVELACSGTLIKLADMGYSTGVITLTRGETGTRGSAETRAQEFEEAARIMGLAVHKMLDIPDAGVEVSSKNREKVIREIRTYRPRIVFAPYWVTRHPDHEKASHLVRESAYLAGLKNLAPGQEPFRPNKVIFYQARFEFKPSFIVDITDVHERKVKAILAYKSQFFQKHRSGPEEEETLISRPEFMERIETRDRQYGGYIGARFGEPFLVREAIRLNDLVEFFGPEYLNSVP